jgi:hypothetical protein
MVWLVISKVANYWQVNHNAQRQYKIKDLPLRSVLFWGIRRRVVVIPYWRFGTTYVFNLQWSRIQEEGNKICPETSLRNYHYTLRDGPEELSSHLLRGESLKSRSPPFISIQINTKMKKLMRLFLVLVLLRLLLFLFHLFLLILLLCCRTCCGSDAGGPDSFPGQSMWDLWQKKCNWESIFSQFVASSCQDHSTISTYVYFAYLPLRLHRPTHLPPTLHKPTHPAPAPHRPTHLPPALHRPTHLPPTLYRPTHLPPTLHRPTHLPPALHRPTHLPPALHRPTHLAPAIDGPTHLPPVMHRTTHLLPALHRPTHLPPTLHRSERKLND